MSRLGLTHRGSGPPLLLLHGLGGDRQVFMPVLDRLAQAREVLAVDLPGFGESPPLPLSVPPTAAELAAEVARWLDEIGLDRVHVAGNSLGGRVALELARQGRARSVTGLSPAGFWSRRELRAARVQLQLAHTVALWLAPHAALVFRWPALRTLLLGSLFARPGRVPPAEAAHALVAYARCPGWQPTFTAAISDPAGDPGGELGVPVTLLWGRRDLLLPPRQRLRAHDRLPAAQIGLLPGCGHVPTWDNPQLVAHVLLSCLRRPVKAASPRTCRSGASRRSRGGLRPAVTTRLQQQEYFVGGEAEKRSLLPIVSIFQETLYFCCRVQ